MSEDSNFIKRKKRIKPTINKKIPHCGNCGKYGHMYKNCIDPITSLGIIDIIIDYKDDVDMDNIPLHISDGKTVYYKDMDTGVSYKDPMDMETFCFYRNRIKFLLICRKHTLGFIEFIRGRYRIENVDGIIYLFEQMTKEEINKIGKSDFDELWTDLWVHKNNTNYDNEYKQAKDKFNMLKDVDNESYLNLDFFVENVKPRYSSPEWGFPKGRRNLRETDLACAKREFSEETGFDDTDYKLLDNIEPIEENLIGTNGIKYRHIYYVGLSNNNNNSPKINLENSVQCNEVGDIKWFTYDEAIKNIRKYHTERREILTKVYMFVLNQIISIKNSRHVVPVSSEF